MQRDLETLSKTLWEAFEHAAERQPDYEDNDYASSSYPINNAIEGRKAMAGLARAIVEVEREKREAAQQAAAFQLVGKK
jgi:hypothetical protein